MRDLVVGVLLVALAGPAGAEAWRWRDATGQLHYSNVRAHAPAGATSVQGRIGYATGVATTPGPQVASTSPGRVACQREVCAIKRQLNDIHGFYDAVRARQLARLLRGYPNVELLPDWLAGDQWVAAHEAELRLQAQLAELEVRTRVP
jgi:hypothetical protein